MIALLGEDYTGAIESTRTGLALLTNIDDVGAQAACLLFSSMVLIQTGTDLGEGLHNAERAVDRQRRAHDPLGLAFALVNLAVAAGLCERFDQLRSAYDEFLTIPRARDNARLRAWAEHAAAWAHVAAGSPAAALEHANRAIALDGEWPTMTHFQAVSFRIHALARLGRADQALQEAGHAMRGAKQSGALQAIPAIELALAVTDFMREDLDSTTVRSRRLLAMLHLHTLALAREMLARVALARGDANEAEMQARETRGDRGALRQRSAPRNRELHPRSRGARGR